MNCTLDIVRASRGLWRLRACSLLAALALTPAWAWAGARVRVVDTNASTMFDPDVVCTPGGEILVVYRRANETALRLVRLTAAQVERSIVFDSGTAPDDPSAAIDSLGLLSISHARFSGGLGFTLAGGDVFGLATVSIPGTSGAANPIHMLDAHDQPFVAYRAAFNLPMLARFDIPSGNWTTEAIPGSAIIFSVDRALAIARDRQDRPTVAYYDQSRNIQLATRTPGGWTLRTHSLQQSSPASTGVALDFDSENAAHVATRVGSRLSILRFGTLGVSTIYTSDSTAPLQINPHSMRVDSNNGVSIAHLDLAQGTIAVATRGANWSTTVVDKPFFATAPSLALDPSHRWVIAYTDAIKGQLKVSAKAWWDFARPDFDDDGHIDGQDVQHFAACVTGPGVTQSELTCFDADLDDDGDVDQADFGVLQACYSGPVDAANPQCGD